jgi:Zn finger protein HypA/HybF involved in hydrogenase expression
MINKYICLDCGHYFVDNEGPDLCCTECLSINLEIIDDSNTNDDVEDIDGHYEGSFG